MAMRRRVALMVLAAAVQMSRPPHVTLMAMRRWARGGAVGLMVSSRYWRGGLRVTGERLGGAVCGLGGVLCGLVVRLAPVSFSVSRCGGVGLFPFFWLGRPPQLGWYHPLWGGCVSPLGWVCVPLLAGRAARRRRRARRFGCGGRFVFGLGGVSSWGLGSFGVPFSACGFGWVAFLLSWSPCTGFSLSFGLVGVAALGGRKARCRARRRRRYAVVLLVRRLGRWLVSAPQGGALSSAALLAFRCGLIGRQSDQPPSSSGAWLPRSC